MSGGAVITWSWNGRLVSAGAMRVYTDERIVVREEGRDLLVRAVSLEDRGEWSCTVQLKQEPVSLAHRLEILVAPSISLDHSQVRSEAGDLPAPDLLILALQEIVSLEEGSSAKFSCSATGFPAPSVHWVRGDTGVQVARGPGLSLARVTADMSGTYSCVAANSEGEASQTLSLNVLCECKLQYRAKSRELRMHQHISNTESNFQCIYQQPPTSYL